MTEKNYTMDEADSLYEFAIFFWYEYIKRYEEQNNKKIFTIARQKYNDIIKKIKQIDCFDEDCEYFLFDALRKTYLKKKSITTKYYCRHIEHGEYTCKILDFISSKETEDYLQSSGNIIKKYPCNESDLFRKHDILSILDGWVHLKKQSCWENSKDRIGDTIITNGEQLPDGTYCDDGILICEVFPMPLPPNISSFFTDDVKISLNFTLSPQGIWNKDWSTEGNYHLWAEVAKKRQNLLMKEKFQINSIEGRLCGLFLWDYKKKHNISVTQMLERIKNSQDKKFDTISKIKEDTLRNHYNKETKRIKKIGSSYSL